MQSPETECTSSGSHTPKIMLIAVYHKASHHYHWLQKNKIHLIWQMICVWSVAFYILWTPRCLWWGFKIALNASSSKNQCISGRPPRAPVSERPRTSVSQGHYLSVWIASFPLSSFSVDCQFLLLQMFPGIFNLIFLFPFLQEEGLSSHRYSDLCDTKTLSM